ncbi:reverse transcriptase domain-containing protein [Tanacetum coccineum]
MVCVLLKEDAPPDKPDIVKKNLCTMVHVFGTNSWREIPQVPSYPISWEAVFVNGCLHWLASHSDIKTGDGGREVIWFDVNKEEFGFMESPKRMCALRRYPSFLRDKLVDLNGEVGYVSNNNNTLNSPILLSKWSPTLSLKKEEVNKVPVWVKLYSVPVLAYSGDGLSLIATKIEKPVMLDAFTSSMCVDSWGRISFARALIEVCAYSSLKKEVVMAIENEEGDEYTREVIRVEYEWKPPHCVECKCFGHDPNSCPKRVVVPKTTSKAPTTSSAVYNEDGFVAVTNRKKKKKTGPNRVSGVKLSKCNPNLKYRSVSQSRKGNGEASKVNTGPMKGSLQDNVSGNTYVDEVVSIKNSFVNLMEELLGLDENQSVSNAVNAEGNDIGEKDGKVASSSKSKITSLDDDSDDDEEVYMPDGMAGGGSMYGLEDDLDCYDDYGT